MNDNCRGRPTASLRLMPWISASFPEDQVRDENENNPTCVDAVFEAFEDAGSIPATSTIF